MPMCGGLTTSVRPSNEDKQLLTPVVKDYIAQQLGREPSEVKITEVSRQIVNGTNHFLKVEHDGNCWHVRVHEALPCYGGKVEVHSHKVASVGDPLTYF
ncbi:Cystatin B Stefin B [Echinococcus multilocularis]|uniref:Cystatin B Stefin B n=1 Tax=Echinococcus multilocularis TaxID=6211 RepID=A0A087VZV0_ECHMU|nr:Cystatin B Stefin B [Echinococcus multilocularis]